MGADRFVRAHSLHEVSVMKTLLFFVVSFLASIIGAICGIGGGTVLAMFGTGRVIALFNKFFGARLRKAAASPDSGASERKVTA